MNLVELFTIVSHHSLHWQIKLADENALVVRVHNGTYLSHDLVNARLISRMEVKLANIWRIARLPIRVHWIIAELLILEQQPENVDAETIDAPVEPEAQHIIHCLTHTGIAPVQIGLLHIEQVQIVLPCLLVKLPGRAAKITRPVIGRTTIRCGVTPHVPVAFLVGMAGTCLLKPGVLIGGVIGHKIQDDLEVALVGLVQQGVEVAQRPEEWMDTGVIANIIAKIGHG